MLNAANEIAVAAFLEGRIGFRRMSELIEHALTTHTTTPHYDLESLEGIDLEVRRHSTEWLARH